MNVDRLMLYFGDIIFVFYKIKIVLLLGGVIKIENFRLCERWVRMIFWGM